MTTDPKLSEEQEDQLITWFAAGDDIAAVRERIRYDDLSHSGCSPWPELGRQALEGFRERTKSAVARAMMQRTDQALLRGLAQRSVQIARQADAITGMDFIIELAQKDLVTLLAMGALSVDPSRINFEVDKVAKIIELTAELPAKYASLNRIGLDPQQIYLADMLFERAIKILGAIATLVGVRTKQMETMGRFAGTIDSEEPADSSRRKALVEELIDKIGARRATAADAEPSDLKELPPGKSA